MVATNTKPSKSDIRELIGMLLDSGEEKLADKLPDLSQPWTGDFFYELAILRHGLNALCSRWPWEMGDSLSNILRLWADRLDKKVAAILEKREKNAVGEPFELSTITPFEPGFSVARAFAYLLDNEDEIEVGVTAESLESFENFQTAVKSETGLTLRKPEGDWATIVEAAKGGAQ